MDNSAVLDSISAPSVKYKLQPWIVCFSAALFFFYEFIQLNMFDSISTQLMHTFSVSSTQLGNLSAMFLYADVLFLLPAGIILDRVSVRTVILTAMSICVIGTILFSQATTFWFAASCHFISGISHAFSFLSCFILASRWFPPRRLALVTGLIVTFAMAGGMVAQTPLTLLLQHMSWRHAVLFNGFFGMLLLFIIWLFVKDAPTGYRKHTPTEELPFLKTLVLAAKNINTWLYALYTSLLDFPIMVLGAVWGVLSLTQLRGLSAEAASFVTSMIFLGTIIGGPIMGWLSDRIQRRKLPMIISGLLSLAVMLAIIYLPAPSLTQLIILFLLLGFFTSAQIIAYPAITEGIPKSITGTSMGIASVIIMGGAAVSQPLFGWLLNLHWNHQWLHGAPLFTDSEIIMALLMIPIAFVIGIIAVSLARETYCKSENS